MSSQDYGTLLMVFFLVILPLAFAFICSDMWGKKGGSHKVGFLLGLLLGVLGLLIVALASPGGGGRTSQPSYRGGTRAAAGAPHVSWATKKALPPDTDPGIADESEGDAGWDSADEDDGAEPDELTRGDEVPIRKITYEFGRAAVTPDGSIVAVGSPEAGAAWLTDDGGLVEPAEGCQFVRIHVAYRTAVDLEELGDVVYAFLLQTDGERSHRSVGERYSAEELWAQADRPLNEGDLAEGVLYFEIPVGSNPTHCAFDCSGQEEGDGLWLRWRLHESGTAHTIGADPATGHYRCQSPGCTFTSESYAGAERHLEETRPSVPPDARRDE